MDRTPHSALAERIDALLPQTQCRRCGYAGCRPYAEAVASGEGIDRCPPGGEETVAAMAAVVSRPVVRLDASLGAPGVATRAVIDETRCIGCTLCIQACPVDAIVGGPKRMHGVLASLCSGCELCLPPCPVDCIVLVPAGRTWGRADAEAARERYRDRAARTTGKAARPHSSRPSPGDEKAPEKPGGAPEVVSVALAQEARRAAVAAALARARARRRSP